LDIEKPGNFEEQRKTFCLPKKKNLLKPTLFVLPSGYILEVSDLFYSDALNNDATILKCLFATSPLQNYVEEGDALLVDRGYRDSVQRAEQAGLDVYMPRLLQGQGTRRVQFTSTEANESRRITACRWLVEATNGFIKNICPFFASKIEAPYKPSLNKFLKIACAMINVDHPRRFHETPAHTATAERMLARMDLANLLQDRIRDMGWDTTTKNKKWRKATQETFVDFPQLSLEDIQELTNGPYQLNQAKRYTSEHMSPNGEYEIFVFREADSLIRAKLFSRFSKVDKHNVWVQYSTDRVGIANILGHYCTCKTGARTVGTCSHVTSVR
jgi:hypothetical protein